MKVDVRRLSEDIDSTPTGALLSLKPSASKTSIAFLTLEENSPPALMYDRVKALATIVVRTSGWRWWVELCHIIDEENSDVLQ